MDVTALLALQLLGDSALPTGAFVESAGWETAVQRLQITGLGTVRAWLRGALEDGLSGIEMPHLARAHRAPAPWAVDRQLERWVTVRAWGDASRSVGKRMLTLAGEPARPCHRAAAFGWLCGRWGVPAAAALAAFTQAVLWGQAQVAVRLGAVTADQAVGLIQELREPIASQARVALDRRVRPTLAVAHELCGMAQAALSVRLFAS